MDIDRDIRFNRYRQLNPLVIAEEVSHFASCNWQVTHICVAPLVVPDLEDLPFQNYFMRSNKESEIAVGNLGRLFGKIVLLMDDQRSPIPFKELGTGVIIYCANSWNARVDLEKLGPEYYTWEFIGSIVMQNKSAVSILFGGAT